MFFCKHNLFKHHVPNQKAGLMTFSKIINVQNQLPIRFSTALMRKKIF